MATGRDDWWRPPSALVRILSATTLHAGWGRRRRGGCITSPVPGCKGGGLGGFINKYKHAKSFEEARGFTKQTNKNNTFFISVNIYNARYLRITWSASWRVSSWRWRSAALLGCGRWWGLALATSVPVGSPVKRVPPLWQLRGWITVCH